MRQRGFAPVLLLLIIAAVGVTAYIFGRAGTQKTESKTSAILPTGTFKPQIDPIESAKPIISAKPLITAKPVATITPAPTQSPVVRSPEEEEALMRKVLAGFEMYIGASNTAGALMHFTPPLGESAKAKYESIRTKNLPFRLNSWSFMTDYNGKLTISTIKDMFRVGVNECRSNEYECRLLLLELVRDEKAENHFSIYRYYTSAYATGSELGEEIKYQGFGL